jgi:hypothetical protein
MRTIVTRTGETSERATRRTGTQYHLIRVGAEIGLDVWATQHGRTELIDGQTLGTMAA